jgi:hypothetical protein
MKSKRKLLVRLLALAILIGVAVTMFIIGRGHTVYFDNKKLEAPDGTVYKAFYRVDVYVGEERVAKLSEGDRGMVTVMGQNLKITLHITPKKDAKKVGSAVTFELPYSMDGIVYNLPALLQGAEESVYMEEFIPTPVEEDEDADVVVTDEFAMPEEGGEG